MVDTRYIPTVIERELRPVTPRGEMVSDTHSAIVTGAGGTAAGETVIGTITFPAGGPWIIWGVFGFMVAATPTAAEVVAGNMRLNAASGDIVPNPAPSRFPLSAVSSQLGGTLPLTQHPLKIWPTAYEAPGKGVLQLIVNQAVGNTVAPECLLGVLFGKTVPSVRPIIYIDSVRAQVAVAVDTAIGTVTLAEKATRITAVGGILCQDNVITTVEELIGYFRLSSDDVRMPPAQFPFSAVYGAGLGALILNTGAQVPVMIPVDIPVPGGGRIDCFVLLNTAVSTAAEIEIYIAYE
ncbi:hypothetical protein ES708_19357 [subsurface metagenome]